SNLVTAINDSGTGAGVYDDTQPLVMVRSGADYTATNLPMPAGATDGASNTVNNLNVIAGDVKDPTTPTTGPEAALWLPSGNQWNYMNLDLWLNQTDPAAGAQWTLMEATSLTDNGLLAGRGMFDPDGTGPQSAAPRGFVLDVTSLVPEPAGFG